MQEQYTQTCTTNEKGFTILFAVLIASITLAIGLSIFDITIKETELSSSARESQFALFAADTGAECALYWEQQQEAFGPPGNTVNSVNCMGSDWNVSSTNLGGGNRRHTFDWNFPDEPYCGTVIITKRVGPPRSTTIESHGYNRCTSSGVTRVERVLELNF